jgi:GNAT superfamily N-acetyltransferase
MEFHRRDERLQVIGDWPQPVVLRKGWAKATARPWNEESPAATLRLQRGGSRFLGSCAGWLLQTGSTEVLSPALLPTATGAWRAAGFINEAQLRLFEHTLIAPIAPAEHRVDESGWHWRELALLDRMAFERRWYLGEAGLAEAYEATPRATILIVDEEGVPVGFAIVGIGLGVAYLQRLAVKPRRQRHGLGRSLVRASLAWARKQGARTMLLNTQTDNDGAVGLYLGEGFVEVGGLMVLAYRRGGEE